MSLTSRITLDIVAALTSQGDLSTANAKVSKSVVAALDGVSADAIFADSAVLTAGAGSIDLNSLVDLLGNAIDFATLYAVYIRNLESAAPIQIGGTNMVNILNGDTDQIVLPAGGTFLWLSSTGVAVGATDVIPISGADTEQYEIIVIGKE